MAFRRKKPFRRFRRRSRPADIVPLAFCREGVALPISSDAVAGDCNDPFKFAFPLVDGGALDAILRNAAAAASNVGEYYNTQGVTRGLSFLGAKFHCYMTMIWDTLDTSFADTIVTNFTLWSAICVLPTVYDPSSGNRIPLQIPNLFRKDEAQEDVRILYRWNDELMFFDLSGGDFGGRQFCKMTNLGESFLVDLNGTSRDITIGSGSGTGLRQHVVRSRARLNETHEVAWVLNVATGVVAGAAGSDPILGFDVQGLMKVRGR